MCLCYLKEYRSDPYKRFLLSEKFMKRLLEIDSVCQKMLEKLTRQMQAQKGATEKP